MERMHKAIFFIIQNMLCSLETASGIKHYEKWQNMSLSRQTGMCMVSIWVCWVTASHSNTFL